MNFKELRPYLESSAHLKYNLQNFQIIHAPTRLALLFLYFVAVEFDELSTYIHLEFQHDVPHMSTHLDLASSSIEIFMRSEKFLYGDHKI